MRNALTSSRVSHAYLFYGPRGTGKTSTARILAKAINCLTSGKGEPCNKCSMCQAITEARALDVIEIDAASNTGVEDIRSLREKVNYAPSQARYKVYIIDEVHMLSNSASNALLKTLEEPPPQVIFILATTEVHKLLPTILSRCQRFDFRRLSQADIVSKLNQVSLTEGIHIEPEAVRLIARSATGSLRDAENLLEQLATYYGLEISLQQVQSTLGITGDWRIKELVKHIINNDISAGMATINNINKDGLDLHQFNRELVEYLRALLLIKTGSAEAADLTVEDIAELKELAAKAPLERILRATRLFGQLELGFDNYSSLPLELALVDSALASGDKEEFQAKPAVEESRQPPRVAAPPPADFQPRQSAVRAKPASVPAPEAPAKTAAIPTQAQPVKATAATTPLEASTEIERLRLNWKLIIKEAPPDIRKTVALAILRSAPIKLMSLENNTVVLAFRHHVHKEQIEKIENTRVAEKLISGYLGHPCHVQCLLEDNHLLKEALKMGAQITTEEEE